MRLLLRVSLLVLLSGCSVVALPFRATGDAVETIPVVGIVGKPIHAVGDVID